MASTKVSFNALTTAALGLAPALIPLSGVALGVGAGFLAMGVSAGIGLGVVGMSMKRATAAAQTFRGNIGAAPKDMQVYLRALNSLSQATDNFYEKTGGKSLRIATDGIKGLTNASKMLIPIFNGFYPVIKKVSEAFLKWTNGKALKQYTDLIIKTGVPALDHLMNAGRSVIRVLGDGFRAMAPMIVPISAAIDRGAASLRKWADGGGFARFMQYVHDNGPQVREFLKALGMALGHVGQSLAGLGPGALGLATALAKVIAAMPVWMIQAIAVAYEGIRVSMMLYTGVAAVAAGVNWLLADSAIAAASGMEMTRLAALGTVIAAGAMAIWSGICAVATGAWAAATWLLDAALAVLLSPIFLVILAIAALGAAIYMLVANWGVVSRALVAAWNWCWMVIKASAVFYWNQLKLMWSLLWAYFQGIFNIFKNLFTGNWSGMWNAIKNMVAVIWGIIGKMWDNTLGRLGLSWATFSNALKAAWSAVWTFIKNYAIAAWNQIRGAAVAFWNAMKSTFNAALNAVKAGWSAAWSFIRNYVIAAWNQVRSACIVFWNHIKAMFNQGSSWLRNTFWNPVKNFFLKTIPAAFNASATALGKAWAKLKKLVRDPIQAVVNVVYNKGIVSLWNKVAGVFGAPKLSNFTLPNFAKGGKVNGFGTATSDSVPANLSAGEHVWTAKEVRGAGGHGAVASLRSDAMGGKPVRLKGSNGKNGANSYALGGIIPDPGDILGGITGAVKGGFNAVTGFGGDILKKLEKLALGAIGGIINPLIQKAADGGKTAVKKIIPGSPMMEKLIAGGNSLGHTGGKNPQDTTVKNDGLIQTMANYIKKWITAHDIAPTSGGNTAGAQKWADAQVGKPYQLGGFGATMDCSNFMSGIAQVILGKTASPLFTTFAFTGAKKGPATFERDLKAPFMVGVTNEGVGHMAGTLNNKNYEATPPRVRSGPAARGWNDPMFPMHYGMKASMGGGVIPVGEHKNIIDQALKLTGTPPPGTLEQWESGLNTLIQRESGWNSGAVNGSDSNAAAGHPSKGLAQVIQPTFDAYHMPGYTNILDPVSNIAAAIRYIRATYGNITNVQQANASMPPKGYSLGTTSATRGWHKVGENGPEWARFGTGDKVIPSNRTRTMGDGGATVKFENGSIQVNVNGPVTEETMQQVESELLPQLKMMLIAGVGGN